MINFDKYYEKKYKLCVPIRHNCVIIELTLINTK